MAKQVVGYNAESQQWYKKLGVHSAFAGGLMMILGIMELDCYMLLG